MIFEKTYKIKHGPKAFDIDDYVKIRNEEYKKLLNNVKSEQEIQSFFESNPSFVPGAWTPGTKSGHYPLYCSLITQPKLQGLSTKIPDFMWIATHSAGWYPTLIEIENPNKKNFKNNGVPAADFTQAKNQLEQWRTWFNNPSNVQHFMEKYQIPDYMRNQRQMKLHMILVYGRRSEFDSNPNWSKDRLSFTSPDIEIMSYDRLSCDRELSDALTVKLNKNNFYEAISVPPTLKLGPNSSSRLVHIEGLKKAINDNKDISKGRKSFLIERIKYWRTWVNEGEKGITSGNDYE
jgi:hypothetical protein